MNNIKILIISALFFLNLGCSEDFLEQLPEDSFVEATVFTTDANFETFAWGFYEWFSGYTTSGFSSEFGTDLMLNKNVNVGKDGNAWLWNNIAIPARSDNWTKPYERIRRANLLLSNIDNGELTDAQKAHWTSIGYFFRATQHFELLKKYGDIIYVGNLLSELDEDVLFGPKTPRNDVAQNILNDLLFAEANIKPESNGSNTVTVDVVRALISRFGLFEGTWRKYHNLGSENVYFQASANASEKLIASHPELHPSYDEVFNSLSLKDKNGILLYKAYALGETVHRVSSFHKNAAGNWDLTKKAVDKYLTTNGMPIKGGNPQFDGDSNPYDEFRNRDHRLYFTTTPPFKVKTIGEPPLRTSEWEFTDNPADREYIDLMASISDSDHKILPTENWNKFIIVEEPHFKLFDGGQPFSVTSTGYRCTKYYNNFNRGSQRNDLTQAPIFRMGEVMLNYAEAKYELGQFSQTIADATINKLRERGSVAPLTVGAVFNDPDRDMDVNPLLWEIRRERAVELMMENFRFDDLRRWRKLHVYGADEKLGRFVTNSEYGNNLPIQNGAAEGYISSIGVPPGVPLHYYLYPIPSEETVLNKKLKQNPDWIQ